MLPSFPQCPGGLPVHRDTNWLLRSLLAASRNSRYESTVPLLHIHPDPYYAVYHLVLRRTARSFRRAQSLKRTIPRERKASWKGGNVKA